jgi:predicted nucleic acid-binding protein
VIVLDSNFLIAVAVKRDVHHVAAHALLELLNAGRWGKGILLEYVFSESVNVIKRRASAIDAIEAGHEMLSSVETEFVKGAEVFDDAWTAFQRDLSTPLSFVDHAIAQVARQRAGGKILTFDRAFRGLPGLTIFPD